MSLDLKELEHGQGLAGHMTCSADVLSLSAAQSLKSSFDVGASLSLMLQICCTRSAAFSGDVTTSDLQLKLQCSRL